MRTLRFLSLALPFVVALGCQPAEHAVLLEIHSPAAISELRVIVQSLDSARRYQEPLFRVDRSAAQIAEAPIRVALDIGRPEYVLVHIDATTPAGDHLIATRCYPIDGVLSDEVLLFGPLGDLDRDGDGFVEDPAAICREPSENGTSTLCDDDLYVCPSQYASDCNPDDPDIHPIAPTICLDGIDQNCDGSDEPCGDLDGDGWNACPENPTEPCDCDDSLPSINPGAHDVCLDGIDQDCDGQDACCDADGDGVVRCANGLPDCNDDDPAIPSAEVCDGVDNNCNGSIDELDECRGPDLDGDGVPACGRPEAGDVCDCNDCDPAIHGGGVERCFPAGIDDDCDGMIDEGCSPNDADGDGVDASRDCDDTDPLFYPPTDGREPPGDICEDGRSNNCLPGEDTSCADDLDEDGWVEIEACENDRNNTPGAPEICDGEDNDCDGIVDEGLSGGADVGWGAVGCVDGVEVAYQTDVTHCGSCRYTCDVIRANTCTSGECVCAATGTECAAAETCCGDGCFDLMNDPLHCGRCDIQCGAGESCVEGLCTCGGTTGAGVGAQACPDTSTGSVENNVCCGDACRDVSMDVDNCGMCGRRCGPNATCTSSHCACVGTWQDCDASSSNGCEVNTATDKNNCGACGTMCQGGQADWACNAGACQPTSCDANFDDCNGVPGDGCEVDLTDDLQHCGGCGNACATGETCSGGTCAAVCGNGIVTAGEGCDDGNTTSGDGCSSACAVETGWSCGPTGRSCAPICGDGLRLGGEACDDGNTGNGDGCSSSCTVETGWNCGPSGLTCTPICGDGRRLGGEACDDGNTGNGDGCSSACTIETGWSCMDNGATPPRSTCGPICGDGRRLGTEGCDDGNTGSGDGCSSSCTVESGWVCNTATPNICTRLCGNGTRDPGEACDDGNTTGGDGCSNGCAVEAGWECDTASPNVCTRLCGNGTRNPGEGCDDGNRAGGDGCSADCMVESGWNCDMGTPNVCTRCGDGTRDTGEACDDGNTTGGDGCSNTCSVEPGWDCDEASPTNCTPLCGNGVVDTGETCDDGNAEACGTCSADCQTNNSSVTGCPNGTGCVSNADCDSSCDTSVNECR